MSNRKRIHNFFYEEFTTVNEPDFIAFTALFASNANLAAYEIGHMIRDRSTGQAFQIGTQGGLKFWFPLTGSMIRVTAATGFVEHTFAKMSAAPFTVVAPGGVGAFQSGVLLGDLNAGETGYLLTTGNVWVRLAGGPLTTSNPTTTNASSTGGLAQDAVATNVSISTPLVNGITIGGLGDYAMVRLSGAGLV